ncbi:MAG: aldehyde dehydrogenase family protein [Sandaracinaceae bacterium]|nr:aldehyde dehydrogenase family protein [Sandaracinaceae bacterium]
MAIQHGDYLGGHFLSSGNPDAELTILSPADTNDEVGRYAIALEHVDEAVSAARSAQKNFRKLGEEKRRSLLLAYQQRLRANAEELARTIAREIGKPLWDARNEVNAMIGKVDLSLGEGARFTKDEVLANLPGEIRYRPHGVLAVVGPFNFPGHLPNGQIVPALLLGNTVVFKPSDKAPGTVLWMARCFHEAGFGPGVINVVQGGAETAQALVRHADIDGILFTGSLAVGKKIVEANLDRPGRIVALELGGKNASLVFDDCNLERAAREIAYSAFATSGQRCTASSRVIVTKGVADALIDRLSDCARRAVVGYPLDEGVFMGPVISADAKSNLLAAQQVARSAGFEALVEGGSVEVAGHPGFYVRPSLHKAPGANAHAVGYTDHELFGPDLAIHVVDNIDEAIHLANATRFGLTAAVFTSSRAAFESVADELQVGVIHWNRSSAGASGRLPFGGIKDSGNHRPAGITAGAQSVYPLAVYLSPPDDAPLPSWPGLSF